MTRSVRAACLTNYVEIAAAQGLDPWAQLSAAGLPQACVGQPDLRIPVDAVSALLEASAEASGCEAFGLLMAEGRRLSNLGVLGLLSREQETLRQALVSLSRYARVHNDALVVRIEEAQGLATIREELLLGCSGPVRQSTELMVAVAMRLLKMFLGPKWQARQICFSHAPPRHLGVHERVLGQRPLFGQEFNGIVCPSADLDTSMPSADPVLGAYVKSHFVDLHGASTEITAEVRQLALLLLPRGACSIEAVAGELGMTRRTLHRRLAARGETFRDVVRDIRRELVSRYVEDSRRSLTEAAQLLGFADLSSFSRWYRAEFGEPAEARRKARQA
jgi:AraC-like DNA-binding protein